MNVDIESENCSRGLPEDAALLLRRVELRPGRALERLRELGDVVHGAIDAVPVRRVRVGADAGDGRLWFDVLRPGTGEGNEEELLAVTLE